METLRKGTRFLNEQFAAAIPTSGGLITVIARRVGCDYHTAQKRIERSPELMQMLQNERESITDAAVSNIVKAIGDGDLDSSWKWARSHRRDEFAEKSNVDLTSDGKAIQPVTLTIVYQNKEQPKDEPDGNIANPA